jgi:hypothetical protein
MTTKKLSNQLLTAWVQSGGDINKINTMKSAKWFADYIKKNMTNVSLAKLKQDGKIVTRLKPGMLVTYKYDAKYRDTLPMWDEFPMVLITSVESRSWHGLNLHYMPAKERIKIILALLKATETATSELGQLRAIQNVMGAIYKAYLPFTKMYLYSQIVSPALNIDTSSFEMVINMPTAKWHYNS